MSRERITSPAPWVDSIPRGWDAVRNKFILTGSYSGGTPKATQDEFYNDIGLPFISIADMSSVDYVEETEKYLTEAGVADKNLQIVPKGSIIYSMYATVGHVAETKIDATISQAMIALYLKDGYNKDFYKYNLKAVRDYIFSSAEGTTQMNLNAQKVYEIYLMRPPLPEQQAIVRYLDAKCSTIDEAIERHKIIIEKLNRFLTETIANATLHGISNSNMKPSGVEWISQIPETWDIKRGKYLFIETNERSVDGSEELLTVSQYTGITPRSQKNVNMFEAESLAGYKICEVNDIPANTMWLWAGAIGVSSYRGLISPSYNIYRQIDNQYDRVYLDYLLRSTPLVQHYKALSTGIRPSRLRLYPDQFLNIKYPIPPIAEQKAIAKYLDNSKIKVEESISRQTSAIRKLEEYRKSIIYNAVTGKIDCRKKG